VVTLTRVEPSTPRGSEVERFGSAMSEGVGAACLSCCGAHGGLGGGRYGPVAFMRGRRAGRRRREARGLLFDASHGRCLCSDAVLHLWHCFVW
jgi:hypothetical protein